MPSTSARLFRYPSNDSPFSHSIRYFVLPSELRRSIWAGTKLQSQKIRKHVFDYDDFVIRAKDAVGSWARDRLRVDVSLIHFCVSEAHFLNVSLRNTLCYLEWYMVTQEGGQRLTIGTCQTTCATSCLSMPKPAASTHQQL